MRDGTLGVIVFKKRMLQRAIRKDFVPMMLLGILMLCITWGARIIGVHGNGSNAILPENAQAAHTPLNTSRPNPDIKVVAHRGVRMKAPENTLPAIRLAIEMGYSFVEIDVRYTKDRVPVLLHDDKIDRTTNGKGPLKDYTLEEIQKLDAGSWFNPDFAGTRIPTLEQALTEMQGKIGLYLDQKEEPDAATIALLRKYGFFPSDTVINGHCAAFRALAQDAPVMPGARTVEQVIEAIEEFPNPAALNTNCVNLTQDMVDQAHARGVRIFCNTLEAAWPSEEEKAMKNAVRLGADALQTDRPDIFFPLIKKLKAKAAAAN